MQPNFAASEGGEPHPNSFGREHSALEKDILLLSQEIRAKHETLPSAEIARKEIVKSAIALQIQNPTNVQTDNAKPPAILPAYLQKESPEIQLKVEELVEVAIHKGIEASITEAKKIVPFILDALHDTLTTKIYDELKSRKLI